MIRNKSYDQFIEFCDRKGVTLLGWQYRFAEAYLTDVELLLAARPSASGKTFVADLLKEFMNEDEETSDEDDEE